MANHKGSCHCGAVRFEFEHDAVSRGTRCNCSVCTKLGYTALSVKPPQFKLLEGEANLSMYEWGGKTGQRYFCKTCGCHPFGRGDLPQIGGAYVSINLNCVDGLDVSRLEVGYFDGRHNNWMAGLRPEPWPI